MKNTMNQIKSTFATILFLLCLQCWGQTTKVDYTEHLKVIDYWLDAQRDFDKLPGLSVAIVQDQDVIFQKGYGFADVEKKIPMKPETICSICSISKLFTSVAVMQLWEKGKLRLDDSLTVLLPEYKINQQYAESVPITVRSMLTHSSGLTRDVGEGWNGPKFNFITTEELKKTVLNLETLYPSSTYFQYSNFAMTLLGEIVASKSGVAFNDYVEENVLKPLQLSNTHPYLPEKLWRGEMATGYSGLSRQGERRMLPSFKPNALTPAAGFSSNVLDLAKFASWQLRVLSNTNTEVLKPSTLKEMQRIQWTSPDKKLTWGLGFYIQYQSGGLTTVGHDGSCPGYVSSLMVDPKKKLGVTLMINAQGVDVYKYSDQIFSLLNKEITADTTTKSIDLSVYEGRYDVYDWAGETIVVPFKGKLILFDVPSIAPATGLTEYKYIKKDTFRKIREDDKTLGEELVFERDENGKIKNIRTFYFKMNKIN
jgi:CubicO group peptidase (beta-lactamase class C family)